MPGPSIGFKLLLIVIAEGLALGGPVAASAAEVLQCSHDGKMDVTVTLGAKDAFGQKLGCIEGPFVIAMTACAPKNGYGLSRSSGDYSLVGVAPDWHHSTKTGPITGVKVNPANYLFEGGQLGADHQVKKQWTFEISRSTGQAVEQSAGKTPVRYQCAKAQQNAKAAF